MNLDTLYQRFLECSTICTDTRKIEKDCFFVALKGDNFDGNTFAQQALDEGAKYCMVDTNIDDTDRRILVVKDTLATLQNLATLHRQKLKVPIIALTGSNGKTTTKELINAVLSKKHKTTATVGNLNNHIGVPLTLLRMTTSTEIGIVEMGANHPHEIALLCTIAQPDYGLITNFGKAHLEGFGSVEGVIKAKSELYDYLKAHDKLIFRNENDDTQIKQLQDYAKVYSFGTVQDSDLKLELKETQPYVTLSYKRELIKSQLTGTYNFNNIAVAIAVGSYFEVADKEIVKAIEDYTPTNNRSQIVKKGSNNIIMDAYNANPTSMLAALENFKQLHQNNKILFLGDMFELGHTSASEHQQIVDYLEKNNLGTVYLVGKNFFQTNSSKSIKKFETFDDLKGTLETELINDSYILIKGSRGMALERILELW